MQVPHTEVIVATDGVELARRTVAPGDYVIGRAEDADFPMDTPLASRHRARLTVNSDELRYLSKGWDGVANRPAQTAEEFWKEFDAQKGAAPK